MNRTLDDLLFQIETIEKEMDEYINAGVKQEELNYKVEASYILPRPLLHRLEHIAGITIGAEPRPQNTVRVRESEKQRINEILEVKKEERTQEVKDRYIHLVKLKNRLEHIASH